MKTMFAMILAAGLVGGAATAQERNSTVRDAQDVVTQPVRDVGIDKKDVPAALAEAADDPYSLDQSRTCAQLTNAIRALNEELGPDFGAEPGKKPSLLKAGSAAVVNTLIPFRGIVREVSGAASADRRLAAATQAGIARRGFLRGVYTARNCRTGM